VVAFRLNRTLDESPRHRLASYGYTEKEAGSILEVLLYAQLRGNNQGVVKLIGNGIRQAPDIAKIEIEKALSSSSRFPKPSFWLENRT
jgi:hypothetical protein